MGFDDFQWQNHSKKKNSVQQHELKCFYINARSLIHKFEHFEAWVQDLNPDVIGVTESWAGPEVRDSEIALLGYDLFRQDRPINREGGVLLYIRNTLHAVQVSLSSAFPEQIWCYFLDSLGCRFFVGICYRTPSVTIYGSGNHDLLQDVINELGHTNRHFVLMGDFNYRYLQWPLVVQSRYF